MQDSSTARAISVLGVLACLLTGGTTVANGGVNLRVAYIEGPAAEALQAGLTGEAITYLEKRLEQPAERQLDELASLCAAYILDRQFNAAIGVCDDAVTIDGTALAYNNRGVLRAHLGDLDGSMKDFGRVRVLQEDFKRYIREISEGNARLMATDNLKLIHRLQPEDLPKRRLTRTTHGADIEDPGTIR